MDEVENPICENCGHKFHTHWGESIGDGPCLVLGCNCKEYKGR